MTDVRCHRRKMMGRGPDGGCGTEEKPCSLSRSSSLSRDFRNSLHFYSQARKALSDRSPFESEEALSRVPTLPAVFAAALSNHSEGRRKHRKSHGEPAAKPSAHGQARDVWIATEEYFRPVTLGDIDALIPRVHFVSRPVDSCLSIPVLGDGKEEVKKEEDFDLVPVVVTSSPVPVAVMEEAVKTDVVMEEADDERKEMEIDEIVEKQGDEPSPINWLLGCKHRCLLASERPNKKRKLLGEDAGLDRLLLLPGSQAEGLPLCDFCCSVESCVSSNKFLTCESCKVTVHQKCYGVREVPKEAWLCSWCRQPETVRKSSKKGSDEPNVRPCLLCAKVGGALKPLAGDSGGRLRGAAAKFAHLFCSLWAPELFVEDTEAMEPLMNFGGIQETRKKLVCNVCKVKHGVCVRCSHGTCRTSFHPVCAREAKHRMEVWGKVSHDNVELRAFCSKHSVPQNNGHSEILGNLIACSGDGSSIVKATPPALMKSRLPKLRLSQKNRDASVVQNKSTGSGFEKMDTRKVSLEDDTVTVRLDFDGEAQPNKSGDSEIDHNNSVSNGLNLALILRKLIDRGKINVRDFASEMDISPDSLEAALGETSSFSPGLRSKIVKWLQDSAHVPAYVGHLKHRSVSALPSSNKLAMANPTKVTDPYVPVAVTVAGLDVPDDVLIKSLPPRRRTKSNIRILKDNKALCSSDDTFSEEKDKKLASDLEVPIVLSKDSSRDVNNNNTHIGDQDFSFEGKDSLNPILDDTPKHPISTSLLNSASEENLGKSIDQDLNNEAQTQLQDEVERVQSIDSGIDQTDGDIGNVCNILQGDKLGHQDHDVNAAVSGIPDTNVAGTCGGSCIHPFIQMRLKHMGNPTLFSKKNGEANGNGHVGMHISSEMDTSPASYKHQCFHSSCPDASNGASSTGVDLLSKAKNMGILELSPGDEVEGELLYLQTKLLDNAVAVQRTCEDLLFSVVRNLPRELDAVNKQRWDLVLVNQFLREVREAKKRGRREKRHKEAQAVLAAAAAAVAASSRNSSLRKDQVDDMITSHHESPQKIGTVTGRTASPLVPQVKDNMRTSVAKILSDKHSDIFQIPDILKGNTLACEICRRAETMLNRIFVCSSCKVAVHLDCYQKLKNPIMSWKCELCEDLASRSRSPGYLTMDSMEMSGATIADCALCGGGSGAFRKTADGRWVHAFCAEWLLQSTFRRGQQNPIEGLDAVSKENNMLSCCICHHKVGAYVKCSYGQCQIAFHPTCARNTGLYMNVKMAGGRLQHKAYCDKHSLEQREIDIQQHGAEELKNIRQIRVELEKIRLLCERIVKREKLKKDLALCSHEILASRRDSIAFSMLVRSTYFHHGVSSESATTSINNKSYSGTIQRSDDVTVDSMVSGRRVLRLPLRRDVEGKNDDSSTSPLAVKRKLSDRSAFSSKQLPHRPTSVALRNSKEDEQKPKHAEVFQKELLMTSDEASMQNQRLPKGFAYVPISTLANNTPPPCDSESHEPQEPGG
ncbi:Histone-lysine N-methyltransferase protein [Dioscorea alata]|uniref:Histone-lysine N-methyltransferase protein n=1 Tax=Dioscorea alata TaxID=55571 RepID=A0ACB7VW65_DIOAL|nr:Histone-lysine N-methyltransferase protein [Dioscorea alata]